MNRGSEFITYLQLCFIMMLSTGLLNHVIIIPLMLQQAGRDGWLSVIMLALIVLAWIPLLQRLMKAKGQQALFPWMKATFGPAVAWCVTAIVGLYLWISAFVTVKDTANWAKTSYLPQTPFPYYGIALASLYFRGTSRASIHCHLFGDPASVCRPVRILHHVRQCQIQRLLLNVPAVRARVYAGGSRNGVHRSGFGRTVPPASYPAPDFQDAPLPGTRCACSYFMRVDNRAAYWLDYEFRHQGSGQHPLPGIRAVEIGYGQQIYRTYRFSVHLSMDVGRVYPHFVHGLSDRGAASAQVTVPPAAHVHIFGSDLADCRQFAPKRYAVFKFLEIFFLPGTTAIFLLLSLFLFLMSWFRSRRGTKPRPKDL